MCDYSDSCSLGRDRPEVDALADHYQNTFHQDMRHVRISCSLSPPISLITPILRLHMCLCLYLYCYCQQIVIARAGGNFRDALVAYLGAKTPLGDSLEGELFGRSCSQGTLYKCRQSLLVSANDFRDPPPPLFSSYLLI
jgi:hypothetical protein